MLINSLSVKTSCITRDETSSQATRIDGTISEFSIL